MVRNALEIYALEARWHELAPSELAQNKTLPTLPEKAQHLIDCIWARGWYATMEYYDPDCVNAELNLDNCFDGPQYDSASLLDRRRQTDAREALLLVYVEALSELD